MSDKIDKPVKLPKSTTSIVVNRITFLATVCAVLGAALIWKGFQSGELLIGGAITGLGSLGSILATPRTQPEKPPEVKIANQPDEPVPVEPQPPKP